MNQRRDQCTKNYLTEIFSTTYFSEEAPFLPYLSNWYPHWNGQVLIGEYGENLILKKRSTVGKVVHKRPYLTAVRMGFVFLMTNAAWPKSHFFPVFWIMFEKPEETDDESAIDLNPFPDHWFRNSLQFMKMVSTPDWLLWGYKIVCDAPQQSFSESSSIVFEGSRNGSSSTWTVSSNDRGKL